LSKERVSERCNVRLQRKFPDFEKSFLGQGEARILRGDAKNYAAFCEACS